MTSFTALCEIQVSPGTNGWFVSMLCNGEYAFRVQVTPATTREQILYCIREFFAPLAAQRVVEDMSK